MDFWDELEEIRVDMRRYLLLKEYYEATATTNMGTPQVEFQLEMMEVEIREKIQGFIHRYHDHVNNNRQEELEVMVPHTHM